MVREAAMSEAGASEVLLRGGLCSALLASDIPTNVVLDYAFNQNNAELYVHSHLGWHYWCVSYSVYSILYVSR